MGGVRQQMWIEGTRPPDLESDRCWTPRAIVDAAARIMGGIDTDPAWHPDSHVRPRVHGWTWEDDGLSCAWAGRVWCNPPYSDPAPWIERLALHDGPAMALVKLDPTTAWWRRAQASAAALCLLAKRVRFEGGFAAGGAAPFPCALFAWRVAQPICAPELGRWFRLGGAAG